MEGLEHETDLFAAHFGLLHIIQVGDVAAIQQISAGTRTIQQADQVEQGGFAGTGRPHDGDIIARSDVQVDVAQRGDLLIADSEDAADLGQFDHGWQLRLIFRDIDFRLHARAGLHPVPVQ